MEENSQLDIEEHPQFVTWLQSRSPCDPTDINKKEKKRKSTHIRITTQTTTSK